MSEDGPPPVDVDEQLCAEENVTVREYDADTLREHVPDWDELSKAEKLDRLDSVAPDRTTTSSNTTTIGLHEFIVDTLDPDQAVDRDASHLAVGTDSTTPTSGDTALGNEVFRGAITSSTDSGATLDTSTLIDTSEANGNTLVEVGLVTANPGGVVLNHAPISSVEKTDRKAVTIDVSLTFAAA